MASPIPLSFRALVSLVALFLALGVACRGGGGTGEGDADDEAGADADADGDSDGDGDTGADGDTDADSDGGGDADADGDADGDSDLDESVDADTLECTYDTSIHHDVDCRNVRVNVARDLPGGGDRVRYDLQVELPDGDYDEGCVHLDRLVVRNAGGELRTTSASLAEDLEDWRSLSLIFSFEDEAHPDELVVCEGDERIGLVTIEFHGQSPVGTFGGVCNCACPSDDHQVRWACHRGLEASIGPWVDTMSPLPERPEDNFVLWLEGALGNSGAEPITDVRFTGVSWQRLDDPEIGLELSEPTWTGGGYGHDWRDPIPAGAWAPFVSFWSAQDPELPEGLCLVGSGLSYDSQVRLSGTHSRGDFELETPPFDCLIDEL